MKKFLISEEKYDNNYLKIDNLNSFANDLKDKNNFLYVALEEVSVSSFLYAYIKNLNLSIYGQIEEKTLELYL